MLRITGGKVYDPANGVDGVIKDGLWCAFDAVHMGSGTERYTGSFGGITREAQDDLAAKSHDRATVNGNADDPRLGTSYGIDTT